MPSFPPLGSITICEINRDLVTADSYSDDRANETYGKTLGMVFSPVTFDAAQLLQPSPDEMVEQPGGIERYCGVYDTLKKRYVDLLPQIHTQRVSWHQRKQLTLLLKVSDYEKEVEIMQMTTKEEYLASLRRRSSGFSTGVSKYTGVARHHHNGRWEARIGRVFGNKYLYLGTYGTQEEAAHAYDIAAIEYRGINADQL